MNIRIFFTVLGLLSALCVWSQQTERRYLSGTGLGDGVTWQFYCSEGRNSGKWSKIEVPSQWELQGFGEYTYGRWYKRRGVRIPVWKREFIVIHFVCRRTGEVRTYVCGLMGL